MDQQEPDEVLLVGRVRINGSVTTATLTAVGQLRWSNKCLLVEKEVLGISVEGPKIKIKAALQSGGGICCGSKGALVRKTFVLEPLSEESLQLWSQKLQEYIESLGKVHLPYPKITASIELVVN